MNTSPHTYASHQGYASHHGDASHLSPAGTGGSTDLRDDPGCVSRLEEASRIARLESRVFGFTPMDSLVFVGVKDGRTGGHMRIDRGPAVRDPVGVAQWAAQRMTESRDGVSVPAEAVLVFIFEPQDAIFEPQGAAAEGAGQPRAGTSQPHDNEAALDDLVSTLRDVFEQEYCLPIASIYSVSHTHVRDYGCTEPPCVNTGVRWRSGDPGSATGGSEVCGDISTASGLGVRAHDTGGPVAGADATPGHDDELTSSEAYGRRVLADFLSFGGGAHSGGMPIGGPTLSTAGSTADCTADCTAQDSMRDALKHWDVVLSSPEADPLEALHAQPARLRALSRSLESRSIRDALIPLAAESLDLALQVLPAGSAGTQAEQEHRAMSWLVYRDSVLGESGHAPRWDRVDRLARALQICHPTALGGARENIYGLMAWVEWARGRGSAAGGFIDYCLDRYPDNVLCRLIDELMRRGQICPWARVKEHSWAWESEAGLR